jgi:hypothetical protein
MPGLRSKEGNDIGMGPVSSLATASVSADCPAEGVIDSSMTMASCFPEEVGEGIETVILVQSRSIAGLVINNL